MNESLRLLHQAFQRGTGQMVTEALPTGNAKAALRQLLDLGFELAARRGAWCRVRPSAPTLLRRQGPGNQGHPEHTKANPKGPGRPAQHTEGSPARAMATSDSS